MFMEWLWDVWVYGSDVAAIICCSWAFWHGGPVERIAGGIIAVGWIMTIIFKLPNGAGPGQVVVDIDVAVLILFTFLALWARRWWTIFAAACMLNAVICHFVHLFGGFGIYSYATTSGFWSGYALLICLAFGIFGYRRGVRRQRQKSKIKAPDQG